MKKSISEIVGRIERVGKSSVVVYRALCELMCARCGAVIGEASLFTRRTLPGYNLRLVPQCRKCVPFDLNESINERTQAKTRSPLLASLLSESGDLPPVKRSPAKEIADAIEQRLGPALRRAGRVR